MLSASGTRGRIALSTRPTSATIVVNNFNYERYLSAAIDSALAQTHPSQVVVVDDASTDGSRAVIGAYRDRILPILKSANEGQASAMNVGFAASTGDVVIFLDSDDYLAPAAVETVLAQWRPETVMAHYALTIVDSADRHLGVYPDPPSSLPSGDVRAPLLATGSFVTTVTSGLAFVRAALEQVMPIPLAAFRTSADGYLTRAVAFHGDVQRIEGTLGFYRKHGRNVANVTSAPGGLAEGFRKKIWHARNEFDATRALAAANGLSVSEQLGETNADYLGYRLFSLLLAPEQHPVQGDRRWSLLARYIGARWDSEYSLQRKLLAIGLATAAGFSPQSISEVFLRWLHDPDSRPTWFPSTRSTTEPSDATDEHQHTTSQVHAATSVVTSSAITPAPNPYIILTCPGRFVRRPVFLEDWWLNAATDSRWNAVTVERDGRVVGWLPFAMSSHMGFSLCGQPPLVRLLCPQVETFDGKPESAERERFHVECELIERLPSASCHRFMLPPHESNALAWQSLGFDTRVEHTFVVDAHVSDTDRWSQMRNKTRNSIRRAEKALQVRPIDAPEFSKQYQAILGNEVPAQELLAARRLAAAAIERGQARALAAVGQTGPVQAAVLFVWDSTDYYYFLSTRREDNAEPGAVALLVWDGLLDAWRRGLRFDFDGVSSQGRLRFMQSFGGRLASRVCVERSTTAYSTRLLLRRVRQRVRLGSHPPRFS